MDRFDSMRLFVRVVERRSFVTAATDLGVPRSTATEVIKQLEARLGVQLLRRTTRAVAPTLEGEAYHEHCVAILGQIEEAEGGFRGAQPQGLLRVDAHPLLTRTFLLPHLRAFLDRYPRIQLHLGQGDRLVDLVREGYDCVIRSGVPTEAGMVMRRLGAIEEITVASPAYLERNGTPSTPDELASRDHTAIGFVSSRTHEVMPFELTVAGATRIVKLASRITVNNSDTAADLARLGFGLVQAPRYRFAPDLASGALVEVLASYRPPPTPLVVLYPASRQLSPRVRAFVDWAAAIFTRARF